MTNAFDDRIVKLSLELEGEMVEFEGLAIQASGMKFGSAQMNQCEARIFNLTRDRRNYLLTQASPLKKNRTPIKMFLDIGRQSYGTFRLFEGQVLACGATQPPDIGITLRALTNNYQLGLIAGTSQSSLAQLRTICQECARVNELKLDYQATDKQIDNFYLSGPVAYQIDKICQMGGVIAFIDNKTLVVLDSNKPKAGSNRLINMQNGMVGVPQVFDAGVIVRVMIDNSIELGGQVTIESEINPAANGTYAVRQINFNVANREQPFYYDLVCSNLAYYQGTL